MVHEKQAFKCDICEYEASEKSNLIVHILSIHAKAAVLKCDMCVYATTIENNLSKHIESKHAKRPSRVIGVTMLQEGRAS